MDVRTELDALRALAAAIEAGRTRVELVGAVDRLVSNGRRALKSRLEAVNEAIDAGPPAVADEMPALVAATDGLFNQHAVIALAGAARRHAESFRHDAREALADVQALADAGIAPERLPDEVARELAGGSGADIDPDLSVRSILGLAARGPAEDTARTYLARVARTRLWALHGALLSSIAVAEPDAAAADAAGEVRDESRRRSLGLRDALHERAADLRVTRTAGPAWALGVWQAIDDAETWLSGSAGSLAAATAGASAADAPERLRRDAAMAYDGARRALALAAGGWAILRAWATNDEGVLQRFASAAALDLGAGTLDLPRSGAAELSAAEPGATVEVAGVVADAEIDAGGPAPRSVLRLDGDPDLRVFVPFIAVDSFGVAPGVWLQARGRYLPDGKDDIAGPVVQARRVRREAASERSFLDHLVWEGRGEFELRPGGWDLVAGRRAGAEDAIAELGLRA